MELLLPVTLTIWALFFVVTKQIPSIIQDNEDPEVSDTLVLLHVIFRHGDRTPNGYEELYPLDPYVNETYFPIGLGQLTTVGRLKEYSIGAALRRRYDRFLGDLYYPDIVDPMSTDYGRTKASLLLVLAGLFPPEENDIFGLNWQPIPYKNAPKYGDKVLIGVYCPNYKKLYNEYVQSDKHQTEISEYKQVFDYISINTGLNVTTFHDVYDLYFGLSTEEEWGFQLPRWTQAVWPETIIDLTIKYYFVETATTDLSRMAIGYFYKKLISDTILKIINSNNTRKIHLYSGHENNIADILITLGVFQPPHIPPYGSYIIFETHQIGESYGIKIYYQNYGGNTLHLLKLPACEELCEINKFVSLIEEYLPSEDLCGFTNVC